MSSYEVSATLIKNCRVLCETIKSYTEKTFEKDVYNKLNKDIDNLISQIDDQLRNINNGSNETIDNTLFIPLGAIRTNLNNIKKSISPGFRSNNQSSLLLFPSFYKKPSMLPMQNQKSIGTYLNLLTGALNMLGRDTNSFRSSNNQLKP